MRGLFLVSPSTGPMRHVLLVRLAPCRWSQNSLACGRLFEYSNNATHEDREAEQ